MGFDSRKKPDAKKKVFFFENFKIFNFNLSFTKLVYSPDSMINDTKVKIYKNSQCISDMLLIYWKH